MAEQSVDGPAPGVIVVYSSNWCGFCRAALRLLDSKGWDYTILGVDGDADRRHAMTQLAGRTSVPQIFFGETHVGGFDDLAALEQAGELDALHATMSTLPNDRNHEQSS